MKRTILRRTLAIVLTLAMLLPAIPAVLAADYDGWTSFTADFSQQDHEILHMAMGCLYGIGEEDVPTTNLLTPIRPYTFEQKAPDGRSAASQRRCGTDRQDLPGIRRQMDRGGLPGHQGQLVL